MVLKASILSFVLGAAIAIAVFFHNPSILHPEAEILPALRAGPEKFINPLLACADWKRTNHKEEVKFERELHNKIDGHVKDGNASQIALYARHLNGGPWFGAYADTPFLPGSLLKTVELIGYLKRAETEPDILQRKIKFADAELLKLYSIQGVQPSHKLTLNETYTVEDLLRRSIIYSDNVAATLLEAYDDRKAMIKTANDLHLNLKSGNKFDRVLTVHQFSNVFRVLYNATYLNRESSNRALELLNQTEFRAGIATGASSARIANKFGESHESAIGAVQLHDCGIVYADSPYILCIMTRGLKPDSLLKVVQDLAQYTNAWMAHPSTF